MELKLSPPMDNQGHTISMKGEPECPILFKMNIVGIWAHRLWVSEKDTVRVIGTFNK